MCAIRIIPVASVYIFFVTSNPAWAVVTTESAKGASYLFIFIAFIGGIIALLGIILAFRGVTSPAEVSIEIPGGGTFKFSKVGQGAVLTIIGSIILVFALYLYPTTTTKTVTETTTVEGGGDTRTTHEYMAR